MFDFLRKKITGWLGKKDEKAEKKIGKENRKRKTEKKTRKKEGKNKRTNKSLKNNLSLIQQKKTTSIQTIEHIEEKENVITTPKKITIVQDPVQQEEPPKENFFTRLVKRISTSKLTSEQFNEIFIELELTLLENNVALEAVDKIREHLSAQLVGKETKKADATDFVLNALKESVLSLLIEPPNLLEKIKNSNKPYVILFFGINGTGKTTSIAKIAHLLQKNNISCVLAAADTFRAASIEQLKTHADRLKVQIIAAQYGADPASVAFDAIAYAKKNNIKTVLIDTAGRMYTKDNLLKEMEKIVRISSPDLRFFVGESITGNDVIDQAKTFNESIGIDGIILTKADIDEKAGAILSVSHITSKPIYFLGTGQDYDDLVPFTKKSVLKNLGLE